LYDLLGWFEKEKSTGKEHMQLKTLEFYLRCRKERPYIITHQRVNTHQSDEKKELHVYYLLKPWCMEADLCLSGMNYTETYIKENDRVYRQ